MSESARSMLMLFLVGGPILAILTALAPDAIQPPNKQERTNSISERTQTGEPPSAPVDGINERNAIANLNQGSDEYTEELLLRTTLAQEGQARWAKYQGVAGIIGMFATLSLLYYTHSSLQTSIDAMEVADRPWINVKVVPGGPVVILANGDIGIRVELTVLNIGRSVAQHVDLRIFATPCLFDPGSAQDHRNEVWERFNASTASHQPELGYALFPNDPASRDINLIVRSVDMQTAWQRHMPHLVNTPITQRPIRVLIYGVVSYSQSIKSGQGKLRTTSFGYQLVRIDPLNVMQKSDPIANTLMENLLLTPSRIGLIHAE